jgi:hypothetical protein
VGGDDGGGDGPLIGSATGICGYQCVDQAGPPLWGQPPNSVYIDPQKLGPVMRLFDQLGNWLLDVHWQPNHPEVGNPHLHTPLRWWKPGSSGADPKGPPTTPISAPERPVVPTGTSGEPITIPGAPYSPWPRQPQPTVPIPPVGVSVPVIIVSPCILGLQISSCRKGVGGT